MALHRHSGMPLWRGTGPSPGALGTFLVLGVAEGSEIRVLIPAGSWAPTEDHEVGTRGRLPRLRAQEARGSGSRPLPTSTPSPIFTPLARTEMLREPW